MSPVMLYASVNGVLVTSTENSSKRDVITDTNRRHSQALLIVMGVQSGLKWRKCVPCIVYSHADIGSSIVRITQSVIKAAFSAVEMCSNVWNHVKH